MLRYCSIFTILLFSLNAFAQSDLEKLVTDKMLTLVNQLRAGLQVKPLQVNETLETVAKLHSNYMNENATLTHEQNEPGLKSPFDRIKSFGLTYFHASENVACGFKDAVRTFRQWAFSTNHLKNMINPKYKEIGIARSGNGTQYCKYYWTQNFISQEFSADTIKVPAVDDLNFQALIEELAPLSTDVSNSRSR